MLHKWTSSMEWKLLLYTLEIFLMHQPSRWMQEVVQWIMTIMLLFMKKQGSLGFLQVQELGGCLRWECSYAHPFNPFTTMISLEILLTFCSKIITILLWSICYWINFKFLKSIFFNSHFFPDWFVMILYREILSWSLLGVNGLIWISSKSTILVA